MTRERFVGNRIRETSLCISMEIEFEKSGWFERIASHWIRLVFSNVGNDIEQFKDVGSFVGDCCDGIGEWLKG